MAKETIKWPTLAMTQSALQKSGARKPYLIRSSLRSKLGVLRKTLVRVLLIALLYPYLLAPFYNWINPLSTQALYAMLKGEKIRREWVTLDNISPLFIRSVVVSEDDSFCQNWGIDFEQMNLAINEAIEGERPRGASTLSMQLAKNLFFWNERSYLRKALELPVAVYLNQVLSKSRMLEIYVNIVEFNPGIYGVEAASQYYFQRSADKLNREQATLLATTLPAPDKRHPDQPSSGHRRLANRLIQRINREGADIGCLRI